MTRPQRESETPEFQAALEAYQQILPMLNAETVCDEHHAQIRRAFADNAWEEVPKVANRIDKCEECESPPGMN